MAGETRMDFRRSALMLMAALALGACSSLSDISPFESGGVNYAGGSPAGDRLNGGDRDALAAAFTRAMETGSAQSWRGDRAVGEVTPQGYAIANLKPDPRARIAAARGDFDLAHVMETELGLYVLTRNSNIRTGPGTDNKAVEVLPSGTGVDVVGRVRDRNWMLVAVDGAVRGYVFGDLLIEAPGAELELAGGPMRRPLLCRNFTQRVNVYSERYEWEGAACNDGTGWRLAQDPPPPENAPEELIEF
ncbi:SH3 domain-containing protein [Hyphococcus luteus]|uniref:SH3b domain-containing protein n=1 Tax=Hyphococcus luteus TaxID=2058213 RepID=A0A2S7JZW7_9PROT|nr:SH3 domain-containing protein [Marinicaulis flavus]PQA85805.1 hypothetical protein CW354_19865 [Marinicaulis flavus]